mmetsp:Transcript_1017/g.1466  ORF Transcript_1017/g.1466 Transcript_1017/m.1466 type:complete len:301 (+) Transcript_1017:347-1249(+)
MQKRLKILMKMHRIQNLNKRMTKRKRRKKKKEDNTPFGQTLAALKKKKTKEMNQDEKDKICMGILGRMNDAFLEDNEARAREEPALRKIQLLPTVRRVFNQRALHNTLLEFDALVVICDWLRPLADNSLPSLAIRTAMLEIMQPLPAQPEHLKKLTGSGTNVGRIVMKYSRDPRETPANRRLARKLVEAWSRPVIGRGVSFKSLETQQEQDFGFVQIRGNAPKIDHSKDDIDDQYQANLTDEQQQSDRVRVPQFHGFEFIVRPQPSIDASALNSSKSGKYHSESAKGRISKKVKSRARPS